MSTKFFYNVINNKKIGSLYREENYKMQEKNAKIYEQLKIIKDKKLKIKIYDYITENLSPIGQFYKFRVYVKWWIDKLKKI